MKIAAVSAPRFEWVVSKTRLSDFVTLMKPRVMILAVFTAFVGMAIAPGHLDPLLAFYCHSRNRDRGWCRRRSQHVVRRRHRCPDAAHRHAPHPSRCCVAQGGTGLWACPCRRGSGGSSLGTQLQDGCAARLHGVLLRRRVYGLVEAAHAPEHRNRRRCWRASSGDRLGRSNWRDRARAAHSIPHHLPVDAATFLGPIA